MATLSWAERATTRLPRTLVATPKCPRTFRRCPFNPLTNLRTVGAPPTALLHLSTRLVTRPRPWSNYINWEFFWIGRPPESDNRRWQNLLYRWPTRLTRQPNLPPDNNRRYPLKKSTCNVPYLPEWGPRVRNCLRQHPIPRLIRPHPTESGQVSPLRKCRNPALEVLLALRKHLYRSVHSEQNLRREGRAR